MTDRPPVLPLDEQLCFALYSASMAMSRTYKPLLDRLGLTYPQYLVLHTLWEEDARPIGVIAERLGLESSTVTPLVKRMEAAGLVERARSARDERQVRVTLTKQGQALRVDSWCLAETVAGHTALDPCDARALTADLRTLRDTMARATADA